MKKFLITTLSIVCFLQIPKAQTTDRSKIIGELSKVMERYKNTSYLSFDISYRYSAEREPGRYLDSISGAFKIHKGLYWYKMDSTEMINNREHGIMLFKEDQIIYLSKPTTEIAPNNPMLILDSLFLANGKTFELAELSGYKQISVEFDGSTKVKKMDYYIDKKSGFISKAVYVIASGMLYESSVQPLIENPEGNFVSVEVNMTNYKTGNFNEQFFSTSRFLKKHGEQYVAVAPYEAFKIFVGTPN